MKISTEINGKKYIFELDRATYKNLLQDQEYAKIQNELFEKVQKDGQDVSSFIDSKSLLDNLVMSEKIFYYSLLKNQPGMTMEEASSLMDKMIEEDGSMNGVMEVTQELLNSFIEGTTNRKAKKRVLIKG